MAKLSSGSESEEEEEEKWGSDKEVAKQHPSHPRHHGKLARTDGHIANGGGSRSATEPREHSQRTENGAAVERKSPPTLDCLQQLRNLNRQLKASLMRGHDDHANALAIFDQICAVPATLVQLTQASDLTDCVKKVLFFTPPSPLCFSHLLWAITFDRFTFCFVALGGREAV
ncbi:unnamed protein product [Dibothriocephalus latus]|uniref:Uncharacterized protein n=1 Tax=Dibothriocephalus latus TaxID=60516 RepID=A0A3P7MS10_DIBLA|nr:unnamed protein product [Dibothriocephalus latus]